MYVHISTTSNATGEFRFRDRTNTHTHTWKYTQFYRFNTLLSRSVCKDGNKIKSEDKITSVNRENLLLEKMEILLLSNVKY